MKEHSPEQLTDEELMARIGTKKEELIRGTEELNILLGTAVMRQLVTLEEREEIVAEVLG